MRPVIGIPCQADYRAGSQRPIYGNNRTYVHAVESAGGLPILIPMLNDIEKLEDLLPRLDGILFSGGIDIQPGLYGEEKHPATDAFDPQLDVFEAALMNWALQEDIPILGVCRGMQLLNVVLGGSLYQDIADQYSTTLNHCQRDLPRTELTHQVIIEKDSRTAKVLGILEFRINSLHHQAVKIPGKGVHISGRSEDGLAELLEVSGHRFALGIQGHPEEVLSSVPACFNLFQGFVNACTGIVTEELVTPPVTLVEARP